MTMPAVTPRPAAGRRGISLLEVLISIGIISIGLLATFSLIPAGRSYMHKAAVDDRAAAIIPAAFETIAARGLLTTSALSWQPVPDGTFNDPEWHANPLLRTVIREQNGRDVTDPVAYPGTTGMTRDDLWTIETIGTETITSFYDRTTPFSTLTGTVNPGSPPASRTVTVASSPVSGPNGAVSSNAGNGRWTLNIAPGILPLPAPDMQITTSGGGVGNVSNTPYTDYTFTATYTDDMGTPQTSNVTPSSPYRQYGRRRKVDHRTGNATLTYTLPSNAAMTNQTSEDPDLIPFSTLENASASGRNSIARSVTKNVSGTLWHMTLGTVRGPYTQDVDFADTNNASPVPRTPDCNTVDITVNAGSFVSGSTEAKDAADWYRFQVRAAEIIKIRDRGSSTGSLAKDPETNTRYFPAYLNFETNPLTPLPGFADADYYFVPQDGMLLMRAALSPAAVNTFGPAGQPRYDTATNTLRRGNPSYNIEISRLPSERTVVVDPIAATRLDKAIINSATDENRLRRLRFADFVQTYGPGSLLAGTSQQRIIPRLNWNALAQTVTATDVDAAIAAAELLFRESDSLLVDTSGTFATADGAPGPLFDRDGSGNPVRRQSAGRMSWLMMLQPEDPGPVSVNWTAGKWFDVSVVVFEDRPLPALSGGPFTGEYAQANVAGQRPLRGVWSDLDGALTVEIPASGTDLTDDDEIRRLFRTGAWILLAPKVIDPNESPLENTTRLDWVRVQSARLGSAGGVRTVSLLLETEPGATTLNRGLQATAPSYEVVVLAYSGVVAVVNRSVQLE
jgi:hypothetical protein